MRTLLALLLAALAVGCAHTGKTPVRKAPPLPPLPPGFKATKATPEQAARFAPASVEPTVTPGTGILQAPEIYNDPDFGPIFVARAYQGPNTELTVTRSENLQTWNAVANFGCWPTEQVFLVVTSASGPYRFMRGTHSTCAPTFQPASAARLGPSKNFKTKAGPVKAARIEGIAVAEGFSVWKVLP